MLAADPFEIIVALKDLASEGFAKVREELTATEATANKTNLSGFSKAANTAEADAAGAAKGVGGLGSSMLAMAGGPVGLAVAGLGAVAVAGIELTKTYDEVEAQEKAAATAAKDHGIALDDLNAFMETAIKENEQYGFGADDTRAAVTKLTEAGMSLADQQKALGPIADLARAKNISLTDAAKAYELAVMGNARALKEFGITLPKVTDAEKQQADAEKAVETASGNLLKAQDALKLMHDQLSAKKKISAADDDRLMTATQKVTEAEAILTVKQQALTAVQDAATNAASRQEMINEDLTKALGDQRSSVTEAQKAHAKLGDAWERLATVVGPPLEAFFAGLLDVIAWLVDRLSDLIGWLGRVGDAIMRSPIGGFIKMVADFVGGVAGKLGDIIGSIGNAIPHFASGGVVEPRAGGTIALLGEAGEREYVIPESRMGSIASGGASTVNVHLYLDGDEIAYAMERPLGRLLNLRGSNAVNFGLGG